jgi:pimeloyl-ACP methyl ester carboxylesterase
MAGSMELALADGRTLVAHDTGEPDGGSRLLVLWHHGSPQSGRILAPLADAAGPRGIRIVSFGRAAYGGSTRNVGRDVASVGIDAERLMDALGVERFAVMGASGGGPHALACAARMPGRVIAAATFASPSPYTTAFDWFEGMQAPGGLRAALSGLEARTAYAATDEFDPGQFIAADFATLAGPWKALGADAGREGEAGPDGLIDDDVAFASAWGFDRAEVATSVLLVQGGLDRVIPASHARHLLSELPDAQLWLRPHDGHVSVLEAVPVAMDWLLDRAATSATA